MNCPSNLFIFLNELKFQRYFILQGETIRINGTEIVETTHLNFGDYLKLRMKIENSYTAHIQMLKNKSFIETMFLFKVRFS